MAPPGATSALFNSKAEAADMESAASDAARNSLFKAMLISLALNIFCPSHQLGVAFAPSLPLWGQVSLLLGRPSHQLGVAFAPSLPLWGQVSLLLGRPSHQLGVAFAPGLVRFK
jgi:hypothetical protein